MKNLKPVVEKILKMRDASLSDADIKGLLELEQDVSVILEEFKNEKDLRTVKEVAEMLEKGIPNAKEKFNYHKVLRLVEKGKLEPHGKKTSNIKGYRFHIDTINKFIEDANKSTGDWQNRVVELEEELKKALENIEKLKKKNTTLTNTNKKLTDKNKELTEENKKLKEKEKKND